MRKQQKNQIAELLKTMQESHKNIKKYMEKKQCEEVLELLIHCQEAACRIGETIEKTEQELESLIHHLEEYCEYLYQVSLFYAGNEDEQGASEKELAMEGQECEPQQIYQQLQSRLLYLENKMESEIRVEFEIAFVPYKASMWDCLESIWSTASKDKRCHCYVVPIPYYDRNPDQTLGKMHYEGDLFPQYVPIVSYEEYDFSSRKPDIIYFHNQYDGTNYVTCIDERFFSTELKKYTDLLVYVPYYVLGSFTDLFSGQRVCIGAATETADKIIVQSNVHAQFYLRNGYKRNKLLVLGSPKLDAAISMNKVEVPQPWEKVIKGKTVFLFNTALEQLLKTNQWFSMIASVLTYFQRKKNCALIWRPHPLLETTIRTMRPHLMQEYHQARQEMTEMENVIYDDTPAVYTAMKVSHALISDYSSIVMQYSVTGKPTLLLTGKSERRKTDYIVMNYFGNYFLEDGMSVEEFCAMVEQGKDEKKEQRMNWLRCSAANTDGTCGQKVHEYMMRKAEGK